MLAGAAASSITKGEKGGRLMNTPEHYWQDVLFFFDGKPWALPLYEALIWIAAIASVISAITYLSQNIQYINTTK